MEPVWNKDSDGYCFELYADDDARSLATDLVNEFGSETLRSMLLDGHDRAGTTVYMIARVNLLMIARSSDGTVVGFLAAEEEGKRVANCHLLYVRPEFRRQGHATRLLEQLDLLLPVAEVTTVQVGVLNSVSAKIFDARRALSSMSYTILRPSDAELRSGDRNLELGNW